MAPRWPWQSPYVERLISSIRRECLNHIVVLNESSLRRILKSYTQYYLLSRTHLALSKDAPEPRRFNRQNGVPWWRFRRLAAFTIVTTDERLEAFRRYGFPEIPSEIGHSRGAQGPPHGCRWQSAQTSNRPPRAGGRLSK